MASAAASSSRSAVAMPVRRRRAAPAVSSADRSRSWARYPTTASGGASSTAPASGRSSPASMRRRVVLPTPFGPTTPTRASGPTVSETSASTTTLARSRRRLRAVSTPTANQPAAYAAVNSAYDRVSGIWGPGTWGPGTSALGLGAVDDLDLGEAVVAPRPVLDPDAAPLGPPEGLVGSQGQMSVDPRRAALEAGGHLGAALGIRTPHRAGEAEVGGVGPLDGVVDVAVRDDRQRRAELLLVDDAGAVGHVGQDRGLVEVALVAHRL